MLDAVDYQKYFAPRGPWRPARQAAIGGEAPWNWAIPTLHQVLSDPHGDWSPPFVDSKPGAAHYIQEFGTVDERLAGVAPYWTSLLTLTWGCLGWVRPDLGVHAWIDAGRPAPKDQASLVILERWWGESASMLVEWTAAGGNLPHASEVVNRAVKGRATKDWMPGEPPRFHRWPGVTTGGSDSLHISWHAGPLLCEPEDEGGVVVSQPSHEGRSAALILDKYAGWYRKLAEAGAALPSRSDGRRWQVDVVVRPLGWLGTFRRSDITGRWFSGRHRWHMLGWNGVAI